MSQRPAKKRMVSGVSGLVKWPRRMVNEVFKMLNGLTRINPEMFWEVRDARRGPRLVKEMAVNGRKQRHTFFSYRVIQKWNLLPADAKMAKSLDSFKDRLDERILKAN